MRKRSFIVIILLFSIFLPGKDTSAYFNLLKFGEHHSPAKAIKERIEKKTEQGRQRNFVIEISMPAEEVKKPKPKKSSERGAFVYTVQENDSVSMLAKKYAVSEDSIVRTNKLRNVNVIISGSKLLIPVEKDVQEFYPVALNDDESGFIEEAESTAYDVSGYSKGNYSKSEEEALKVIRKICQEEGVPWQVFAALSKQESSLGKAMIGDGGRSGGWYHILMDTHGVSFKQACDLEWSTRWAINYLYGHCGYNINPFNALRIWNGSLDNHATFVHARSVTRIALERFNYKIGVGVLS